MDPLKFYKCLADDTRLKSLLLITQFSELCVCDLVSALALSQPKISRHLADLRKCQVLADERRSRWVYYQLHPDLPDWAREVLTTTLVSNKNIISTELANLSAQKACC